MIRKTFLSLAVSGVCSLLAAAPHPFSVMDKAAENIVKPRANNELKAAFPNAPFTQEELAAGFRVTAVDLNYQGRHAYTSSDTKATQDLTLLTAPGDYTVDSFSIFAGKDIPEIKLQFSNLVSDEGKIIPAAEVNVFEIAPYGKVPRYPYCRLIYAPQLKNIKANEEIDLLAMVNVPENTPAGVYRGEIKLIAGDKSQSMKIALRVVGFRIPEVGKNGFFMNGTFYDPKEDPKTRIVQVGFVKENLKKYFDFYKTRRFNTIALYDNILDIRYIDGKVVCDFSAYRELAKAMQESNLTNPRMIIDLRDIGYWANAVSMKLDKLGGKAPKGDIGITMKNRKILTKPTDRYPEKAKELYAEAIRLIKKQAAAENWPEFLLFADEELGNQYGFKIANYESFMPVIMKEAPERAVVIDNGIGFGRAQATEYALRDNAPFRCYNSWTDESLEFAKRDKAEVSGFNYGSSRLANGFTQIRLNSVGHIQWADLWDSYNYQWQFTRLSEDGVVSSLDVERRHEGIIDYAAVKYLETLIDQAEKANKKQLAAYGKDVIKNLISDLEIMHTPAQLQGRNMQNKELKNRRLYLFNAIEEILSALQEKESGSPQLSAVKSQRIVAANDYVVTARNYRNETMAANAELTENFWSKELGPFQYIQEYVNTLKARASSEEDLLLWNRPTYGIARIASLPEGLAVYTEMGVVQPKAPYLYQRPDDDGDMWQDDCIEVFFALPNDQNCHFMYNAAGKKVFMMNGQVIPAKDIKSYVRYPLNEEGGTANKLLIPWKYFGINGQPLAGTVWRFNICREFTSLNNRNLSLTCWAPVFHSFGETDKWGTLVFDKADQNKDVKTVFDVEKQPTKLIISGEVYECFANAAAAENNLILQGVLTDAQGRQIKLNDTALPLGESRISIDTAGLQAGFWKVNFNVKGQTAKAENSGSFIIMDNPWK